MTIGTKLLLICTLAALKLPATELTAAFISWDVTIPGAAAQFDIANQTGPNSSGDTTAPITTPLGLGNLKLIVTFADGSTLNLGSSDFTLNPFDGLSFESKTIPVGGGNPLPTKAVLTGTFLTTNVTGFDGTKYTILPDFSAVISNGGPALADGDLAIIYATATPQVTSTAAEPASLSLLVLVLGVLVLADFKGKRARMRTKHFVALVGVVLSARILSAQITMNVSTQPSSGLSGTAVVNAIGSHFPISNGTINPADITVSLASSCGGPTTASTPATGIKLVTGTQERVGFQLPSTLVAGTYFVTLAGTTSDGTKFQSTAGSCSEVSVTHTTPALAACVASGSLAVNVPPAGGTVTAYAPNGCWNCNQKGVTAVVVEGTPSHTAIATPNVVNSCASNPNTGKTVCVGNNTDVYLIDGTSVTKTLQTSSDSTVSPGGGTCNNCGIAINALTNKAIITIGLNFNTHFPARSGLQVLDLNTNAFSAPFPTTQVISEEISIDPLRGYILNPGADSNYDLITFAADGSMTEFGNLLPGDIELEAAAEDCSTGIVLASNENGVGLFMSDLTQAKFTAGKPGTWTSSQQFTKLQSGTAIAVAQGSSHLGFLSTEFVNQGPFTVIQLPATSGTGVPDIVDYANSNIPGFNAFGDPHPMTAYTSPNDGKAYGLLASGVPATAIAQIDLACVLALPRVPGTHNVADSANSCIHTLDTGNAPLSPPQITYLPRTTAIAGILYGDRVGASDANDFTLTFSLPAAPTGMHIDSLSGDIQWVPDPSQVGVQNVTVKVTDVFGLSASQSYQMTVSAPYDLPPVITSTPVTSVTVTQVYKYQVTATDANPSSLQYSLAYAPIGMTVDPTTGLIQWTPSSGLGGQTADVTVQVRNARYFYASQSFKISLLPTQNHPPVITSTPVTSATVGQLYTYQLRASDPDSDPLAFSFISAPVGMSVDATSGLIQWTPANSDVGDWSVSVRVQDPGKLVGTQQFNLHVARAYPVPTITITSPARGTVVKGPIDITANISDPSGTQPPIDWTIDLIRADNKDTRRIGAGSGAVTGGVVAHFDPTSVRDDSYFISITVSKAGQVDSQLFDYGVATQNLKLGNFRTSFTDISLPVAGIPLTISRNYDSLDTSSCDFGAGWCLGLPGSVVDTVQSLPNQGFTPTTRVYVTTPDGKREGFSFTPNPPGFFQIFWTPAFTPDPGVYDTLTVGAAILLDSSDGFSSFLGGPYKPTNYLLTTKDGVQYVIDEVAGLQQIIDRNGNTVNVTPSGLQSSFGPSLGFERDGGGRITKITEPSGNFVRYEYDSIGNLTSSFDQLGNQTKYYYELSSFPHYLTKIEDPLGRPVERNVYDGNGTLIAQCDANGDVVTLSKCATFSSDSNLRLQTIVNARSFKTELLLDERGNILIEKHYTDNFTHLDTVRTYDANNNLLIELDPAGNTTINTYDTVGNRLTRIDPLGHATKSTYNSCNQLLTLTNPAGRVTANTYDGNCNLLMTKDSLGSLTTYKYNSRAQLTDLVDAVGNHRIWTYDSFGFVSSFTDGFGNTRHTTFSPDGDLLSNVDRNGRQVEFVYDKAHRPITETWNTSSARVTSYKYNAAGQLASAADPDSMISIAYTNTGMVSSVDNAETPDIPRVVMTYLYDENSNIISVQDSLGGLTTYTYNALDRAIQITQSGAGVNQKRVDIKYDNAGFVTQLSRYSDLAGLQPVANTIFETDCSGCPGRITAIRHRRTTDNSAIDDLTFGRDSLGNITVAGDSEGAHSYNYDPGGQLLTANHSVSSQPNEFYTYDSVGNRLSSHLSANYTYSYATGNKGSRLTQDQQFTYQYDNEGNLIKKTEIATGSYTQFDYDLRSRLTNETRFAAMGSLLGSARFVYDVFNRRIIATEAGQTAYFVYDGLNPYLKFDGQSLSNRRLYSREVDSILADESARQTRWLFTDQVGSVRDVVNASGEVINHYVYDSFGKILSESNAGVANDIVFAGRELSGSTGMIYFRARLLDPNLGRFVQEDALTPGKYIYALNRPLTVIDPLGLSEFGEYEVVIQNGEELAAEDRYLLGKIRDVASRCAAQVASGNTVPVGWDNELQGLIYAVESLATGCKVRVF